MQQFVAKRFTEIKNKVKLFFLVILNYVNKKVEIGDENIILKTHTF